jgi:hypothetical protein
MNETQQERHLQEIADTTTRQIAGPRQMYNAVSAHEHSYHVSIGGLTSILYCTACGKGWILKSVQRNFRNILLWEPIEEM